MREISLLKPLLKQIVSKALSENGWGIYLKADPLSKIPMQDGGNMYKLTEIDPIELLNAIDQIEIEE